MTTKSWASIPPESQKRWHEVFAASQVGSEVAGACPVCGEHQLHRYYQVGRPVQRESGGQRFVAMGGLWEWCSNCRTYEHASALVPEWWRPDLQVDEHQLTAHPDAPEAAVQRRRQAAATSRRVWVVEFRSFDGEREKVRARLVLTPDGTIVTVAPIEHYRRVVDKDLEHGVPGPGNTYVKRDAGLAFLELLAPNFRGITYSATKVFEMDETEAMTPPPYEPPPKLPFE
jgi:hypothetical protein